MMGFSYDAMQKPESLDHIPQGYSTFITNAGIKDTTPDLGVVFSEKKAAAAAVFTTSSIKGNPVLVGQKHIKNGQIQTVVVNSKNSNVATGKQGYADSVAICKKAAEELGHKKSLVLPSSTGVIGRKLPVEKIEAALDGLKEKLVPAEFTAFARAIMTTDTFPKFVSRKVGKASLVGVAKGSGMIEPGMATMLAYFFTDAEISAQELKKMITKVSDKTFNSLSIDADMSTSDTAFIMANGLAGKVKKGEFQKAFEDAATELTMMLARDGEGATKLLIVDVAGAASDKIARKIGKSIINSPLVKTAIYQGDPNWGRIYMAIGKTPGVDIKEKDINIKWGDPPVKYGDNELDKLQVYLRDNETLHLKVKVGSGKHSWRVYGCDLTEEYVKINAYYTT